MKYINVSLRAFVNVEKPLTYIRLWIGTSGIQSIHLLPKTKIRILFREWIYRVFISLQKLTTRCARSLRREK